jgi:hypothetical protein
MEHGVVRVAGPDRAHDLGLQNVAQICASLPRTEWSETIHDHFESIFTIDRESEELARRAENFDDVRHLLRIRIFDRQVPQGPPNDPKKPVLVGFPLADDLLAAFVFDLPSAMRSVAHDERRSWDIGDDDLRDIAVQNLALDPPPQQAVVPTPDGIAVRVLSGSSLYTASHVLTLPELVGEHPYGAVVALPNRHAVLVHLVESLSVLPAVNAMLGATRGLYRDGPGSISMDLYWVHNHKWTRLPFVVQDRTVVFAPPPSFVALLERLGERPS